MRSITTAMVVLHRWLGIAFCLLFAMWFATGMVMHFVPFPSLTEAERFAGLAEIDTSRVAIGPGDAVEASGLSDAQRVRLIQRSDGPVYIVAGRSQLKAISAVNGAAAPISSMEEALAQARAHATHHGIDASHASAAERITDDQWSVPNGFDRHRPLFRVALGDAAGTEIYVSSVSGEVVLDTARHERWWNLVGSVVHWIYPPILRRHWALWDRVVWSLSLLSAIAAALGAVLGLLRIRLRSGRSISPYRGWQALHHLIGLASTVFLLTWIVSGWLSMDHGRLFSRGQLTASEAATAEPLLDPSALSLTGKGPISKGLISTELISPSVREVEWFAFNQQIYRRDRSANGRQILSRLDHDTLTPLQSDILSPRDVEKMAARLAAACATPSNVVADDAYASFSLVAGAPVYRSICGDVWFDIDSASGMVLQRLDSSRRAYRWFYTALHALDFPILLSHPLMRTVLVVGLCGLGFLFSITGIVIGWRRLQRHVQPQRAAT
jgi:hypothetical protein